MPAKSEDAVVASARTALEIGYEDARPKVVSGACALQPLANAEARRTLSSKPVKLLSSFAPASLNCLHCLGQHIS